MTFARQMFLLSYIFKSEVGLQHLYVSAELMRYVHRYLAVQMIKCFGTYEVLRGVVRKCTLQHTSVIIITNITVITVGH